MVLVRLLAEKKKIRAEHVPVTSYLQLTSLSALVRGLCVLCLLLCGGKSHETQTQQEEARFDEDEGNGVHEQGLQRVQAKVPEGERASRTASFRVALML